jgi:hypothetical protein
LHTGLSQKRGLWRDATPSVVRISVLDRLGTHGCLDMREMSTSGLSRMLSARGLAACRPSPVMQ